MNFIMVGGGRVGRELSHLFKHGHQVAAVDSNKEAVYDPPPSLNGPSEYM